MPWSRQVREVVISLRRALTNSDNAAMQVRILDSRSVRQSISREKLAYEVAKTLLAFAQPQVRPTTFRRYRASYAGTDAHRIEREIKRQRRHGSRQNVGHRRRQHWPRRPRARPRGERVAGQLAATVPHAQTAQKLT